MKPSDLSEEQIQTLFDLFDRGMKPKKAARKTGIEYKVIVSVRATQYLARKRGFKLYAEYRGDWARGRGFESYASYWKHLIEKNYGSYAAYRKHLLKERGIESLTEYEKHLLKERGFETKADYLRHLIPSKSINVIISILHENAASAKEISQEIKKRSGFSVRPSTIERKIRQFYSVGPWVVLDEKTGRYQLKKDHWFVTSTMQELS